MRRQYGCTGTSGISGIGQLCSDWSKDRRESVCFRGSREYLFSHRQANFVRFRVGVAHHSKLEFSMRKLKVSGLVSQSGDKYVRISDGPTEVIASLDQLTTSPQEIKRLLTRHNLIVLGNKTIDSLCEQIEAICDWKPQTIACGVGWVTKGVFALHDGSLHGPAEEHGPIITTMEPDREKGASRGRLYKWKKRVALPLSGQAIPSFAVCFAFTPPLIALIDTMNILFELVSPAARGKTTVQQLASSVWGNPSRNSGQPYWVTMRTTINGLEQTMREHADLPIIMDEANLFANETSPKERAKAFQAIAFILASGMEKERFDRPANRTAFRVGFLSSTNEPLSKLLGQGDDVARAAMERLLTIPIGHERRHGIFDFIPDEHQDAASYIGRLMKAADRNYGLAGPKFVAALASARAEDEAALKKQIGKHITRFRKQLGIDSNNGSQMRISQAFGLVYAAGKLAREYGCLPDDFKVGPAVEATYRLHLAHISELLPFAERLAVLRDNPETVRWSKRKPKAVASAKIIHHRKKGELWIRGRRKDILKIFPDWNAIRRTEEVKAHLIRENDRDHTKRFAGPGLEEVRLYVFRLNDEQEADWV